MNTYSIKFPKKVFSGDGSLGEIKNIIKDTKATSVCLMTDEGIYGCGLADAPLSYIEETGIHPLLVHDIPREPSVYAVQELHKKLSCEKVDLIIAVGGGSVIDMAKILSVTMTNEGLVDDLRKQDAITKPSIPMVAVPTTSGTGAEATANAIFLYPEEDLKVGIISEYMIPDFVILDVNMTCKLPPALTASTGVDALCHAMEAYISVLSNPFCKVFSLEAIQLLCRSIEIAFRDGSNKQAREDMQLGAFYAGLCLTTSSTVAVHALSYPLGGKYHIPHGVSNAILLPFVMKENLECCRQAYTEIAPYMLPNVEQIPKEQWPEAVVDYLFTLMKNLEIPSSLKEFGVSPEDLDYLTDNAVKVERLLLKNPKKLSKEDIKGIYQQLLQN